MPASLWAQRVSALVSGESALHGECLVKTEKSQSEENRLEVKEKLPLKVGK